jgi:hypothetical protein
MRQSTARVQKTAPPATRGKSASVSLLGRTRHYTEEDLAHIPKADRTFTADEVADWVSKGFMPCVDEDGSVYAFSKNPD